MIHITSPNPKCREDKSISYQQVEESVDPVRADDPIVSPKNLLSHLIPGIPVEKDSTNTNSDILSEAEDQPLNESEAYKKLLSSLHSSIGRDSKKPDEQGGSLDSSSLSELSAVKQMEEEVLASNVTPDASSKRFVCTILQKRHSSVALYVCTLLL